jgi:hypothetical protein
LQESGALQALFGAKSMFVATVTAWLARLKNLKRSASAGGDHDRGGCKPAPPPMAPTTHIGGKDRHC